MIRFSRLHGAALVLVEAAIFAGVFWASERLSDWVVPWHAQLISVAAVAVLFGALRLSARDQENTGWLRVGAAAALIAVATWLVGQQFGQNFPARAAIMVTMVSIVCAGLWHRIRVRLGISTERAWGENLRMAVLVIGAVAVFQAYLTPNFLGGLDGRWYLSGLTDSLHQARAGFFPIFVGQGEFQFNGAVHPIRSAPFFHYFGILLDALTFWTLTPVAIQHLVVLVSAVQTALVCYFCLLGLAPKAHWRACGLALLYVSSPVSAAFIYAQEMYMTFTAFAFLPLLIFGNVLLARKDSWIGWVAVAAANAAMWSCHPVTGLTGTFFTVGFQGFRLLAWDFTWAAWRRALLAVAVGGILAAYSLISMSELTSGKMGDPKKIAMESAAWALGSVAFVRALVTGRPIWFGLLLTAAAGLAVTRRTGGTWLAFSAVLGGAVSLLGCRWPHLVSRDHLLWRAAGVVLLAGFLAGWLVPETDPRLQSLTAEVMGLLAAVHPKYLLPISPNALLAGDLQLGYTLWALLGLGVVAAFRMPARRELPLLVVAGAFLTMLVVPIPGITRFLVMVLPDQFFYTVGTTLWLRLTPVLSGIALFAGAVAVLGPEFRGRRWGALGILVLAGAVSWNGLQVRQFIRRGSAATNTMENTITVQRTENTELYTYSYDLLPKPRYFTTSVLDYNLESRLLNPEDFAVRPEPFMQRESDQRVELDATVNAADPHWVNITPKMSLAPGDRQAWAFEFPDRPHNGTFILRGNRGFYRNYRLPLAGFAEKAFGVGPKNSKVIAVWNSTKQAEDIELVFLRDEVPPGNPAYGSFGKIAVRNYRPENLRIKTTSLLPYRAEVTTTEPALLETPRVFIGGYQAKVDGLPVPVEKSPDHLAMVRLPAGSHTVEVTYGGTAKLKTAFAISGVAWLIVVIAGVRVWRRVGTVPA